MNYSSAKQLATLLITLISLHLGYAQDIEDEVNPDSNTFYKALEFDGAERTYIVHVPENLDSKNKLPLLLNFHGYGSNANQQMQYTGFNAIADREKFIVVYPQGSMLGDKTHWNVGGWTLASTADDVGFTSALIDKIKEEYNINEDRIYATGMSNGGYMSFLLACQLSDKIAAIASVTGSMTPQTLKNCNPNHPTPVLQLHGSSDETVPYEGDARWTMSIEDVLNYWTDYNQTDTSVNRQELPDINTSDNSSVESYSYSNGSNDSEVIHYKVINGGHDWFGVRGNMDISSSEIIWEFLSQYTIKGKIK